MPPHTFLACQTTTFTFIVGPSSTPSFFSLISVGRFASDISGKAQLTTRCKVRFEQLTTRCKVRSEKEIL